MQIKFDMDEDYEDSSGHEEEEEIDPWDGDEEE